MKHLAVITARSGSKGLKDKNIKLLEGKPLLVYSIEAAEQSGKFDCIHVSTDSEKYAQIAREHGADVPFLRDAALATDTAGTWDVLRAVVQQYAAIGQQFDTITLLQPTSPLRDAADIKMAFEIFEETGKQEMEEKTGEKLMHVEFPCEVECPAEVLICRDREITEQTLEKFSNLKLIYILSVGCDRIPFRLLEEKGIRVVHTPGEICAKEIAEYVFAGILFFNKNLSIFMQKP